VKLSTINNCLIDNYLTDSGRYDIYTTMKDVQSKIPKHEGYLVEFKEFLGGLSVKELAITLCAFANTDGGDIFIGVADNGHMQGVKISPRLLDVIQNTAREECSPPISISLNPIEIDSSHHVVKISVEKSGHLHSILSGKTYIRVGSQDKKILGDELLRLAETKSKVSFEEYTLDAGIEVIDSESLNRYYEARKKVSNIRRNLTHEEILLKIGLAEATENSIKIKAGAFILFGKEDESVMLQRDFTFVKYDAIDKMYSYREDISLPASRVLDRLMELIRPYNRITEGVHGLVRAEKELYPEAAVREALLNAFAHRDYRISGLKNECRLYPDRLEIISAGTLPSIITLENIDERHYSRNPKTMNALLILGLTEELGQGINLMKDELKKNGNPPPHFIVTSDQFKVIFYKPKIYINTSDRRKLLYEYFVSHEIISRAQIESLLDLRKTSSKNYIQKLLHENYLEKIGNGPRTRYKLKTNR